MFTLSNVINSFIVSLLTSYGNQHVWDKDGYPTIYRIDGIWNLDSFKNIYDVCAWLA